MIGVKGSYIYLLCNHASDLWCLVQQPSHLLLPGLAFDFLSSISSSCFISSHSIPIGGVSETETQEGRAYTDAPNIIRVGDISIRRWDSAQIHSNAMGLPSLLHDIDDMVIQTSSQREGHDTLKPLWKTLIPGCFGSIDDADVKNGAGCQARFDEWMGFDLDDGRGPNTMSMVLQAAKKPHILNKIDITMAREVLFHRK